MKTDIKLKLKIKDIELELSKDEVIQLRDMLNEVFAKERSYIPYVPYREPYRPNPLTWWRYTTGQNTAPTITLCSS